MISVLIVNWNTRELLERCLLAAHESLANTDHEIHVVDNGSDDGSAAMVQSRFPKVHLLVNETNLGFAAANVQAFRASRGEFILLLNTDAVLTPEAMAKLVTALEQNPALGGVTPRLLNPDGTVQRGYHRRQATGWRLLGVFAHNSHLWKDNSLKRQYFMEERDLKTAQRIEQPAATCWLLRRSAIEAAGGLFDAERFPIHFNDADLAERLNQAGWHTDLVPTAEVTHASGSSVNRLDPYLLKELYLVSLVLYVRRRRPFEEYILVKGLLFVACLGILLLTQLGLLHVYFTQPITNKLDSVRRQWKILRSVLRERLPDGWSRPDLSLAP